MKQREYYPFSAKGMQRKRLLQELQNQKRISQNKISDLSSELFFLRSHEQKLKQELKDAERLFKFTTLELSEFFCNDREKDILKMRYGSVNKTPTQEEISEEFGVTRERVRQIIRSAENKIENIDWSQFTDAMVLRKDN